uniref:Uncharacterized protein n=1 Tax=Cupriavidus taiwanensis TaxID=164546 RepID=A0A375HF68_9BURK|nr:protein of unknown function [Cupriavidus taiwanensis]
MPCCHSARSVGQVEATGLEGAVTIGAVVIQKQDVLGAIAHHTVAAEVQYAHIVGVALYLVEPAVEAKGIEARSMSCMAPAALSCSPCSEETRISSVVSGAFGLCRPPRAPLPLSIQRAKCIAEIGGDC